MTDNPSDMAPEHNARGLFAIGPQFITPSDVLAKLMAEAKGTVPDKRCPPNIVEERRAQRIYEGRKAADPETQKRRKYQRHGFAEFLSAIRVA